MKWNKNPKCLYLGHPPVKFFFLWFLVDPGRVSTHYSKGDFLKAAPCQFYCLCEDDIWFFFISAALRTKQNQAAASVQTICSLKWQKEKNQVLQFNSDAMILKWFLSDNWSFYQEKASIYGMMLCDKLLRWEKIGRGVIFCPKNHFFGGKVQFLTKISTFLWENFSELEFLIFLTLKTVPFSTG